MKLPPKTVERLSRYRRVLNKYNSMEEPYIFSHDMAKLMQLTAVQIRRDMMLLGISGNYRNGYNVKSLLESINETLSVPKAQGATIIGMGELGQALSRIISSNPSCPAVIPVTFDTDPQIANQTYHNIPCMDFTKSAELINTHNIKIAVISIITPDIQEIIDSLVISGIKSFINFSGGPFRVPEEVVLKDFDLRTAMDELAYFVND